MIRIKARLEPVPYARVWTNGKQRFNPKRYQDFKEELFLEALDATGGKRLKGKVSIRVKVYRKMPPESLNFGDIDNHLKAVLDSLNGIAFVDDRQVVSAQVELHRGEPRLEIELEELA